MNCDFRRLYLLALPFDPAFVLSILLPPVALFHTRNFLFHFPSKTLLTSKQNFPLVKTRARFGNSKTVLAASFALFFLNIFVLLDGFCVQRCDPYDRTDIRINKKLRINIRINEKSRMEDVAITTRQCKWKESRTIRIEAIATPEKHSLILGENIVIQVRV